jgi:hypothetical protein
VEPESPTYVAPEPSIAFEPEPEPELELAETEQEVAARVPEPAYETWPEPEPEAMSAAEPEPEAASAVEPEPELRAFEPSPGWSESQLDAEAARGPAPEPEPAEEVEPEPATAPEPEPEAAPTESWDRDRYSTRIEEPDWIPEERAADELPATGIRDAEPASPDVPRADADVATADAEGGSPGEPESAAEDRGEEKMQRFGRTPERPMPPWSPGDDPAAEMEIASSGGHAARQPSVPSPTISQHGWPAADDVRPRVPEPSAHPPRSQAAASPASRAYRRLRRIFPG